MWKATFHTRQFSLQFLNTARRLKINQQICPLHNSFVCNTLGLTTQHWLTDMMTTGMGLSIGKWLARSRPCESTQQVCYSGESSCQHEQQMQRRPTVLLIEENAAVRDALEQALEHEDF